LDAARQLATSEPLDCALFDVNLRGSQSWEVADILAARGVPHIFTTGYGDLDLKSLESRAEVLVKPFRADQLGPTLRQVMARRA
jgi:CheY-like chemotaxis protein